MPDQQLRDFFEALGYLASSRRRTKLDIETHPRRQPNLEREYHNLTGINLVPSTNYFIWSPDTNKWGSELRIYFSRSQNTPNMLQPLIVRAQAGVALRDARINNNKFVWKLITHGFRASDTQDEALIRGTVPAEYSEDFERGYNM